jgi:hypothetical protein
MIVKFFKGNPNKGVTGGLEYLEGGTKTRKVAPELLSGNPDTTRELLKQASRFSKAYTYGCLSFEETDISAKQKQTLMSEFEQTLLVGLDPDQYDIVWIEHRDKDRLELNFHVVNMEISTGKALTPYVHSRDIKRIDVWKCIVNDTYGFTDPNDPSKRRTFTFGDNPPPRRDLMKQVDNYLFDLAGEGELNNQEDVINALNAIDGVTVTRNTKSSISFKAEGHEKPIRLKGDMYGKSFRGIENLAEQQAERTRRFRQDRDKRLTANRKELGERNRRLSQQRSAQYKKPTPPEPNNTNAPERSAVSERNAAGQVPDARVRDKYVPKVPPSSGIEREPEGVLLQDQITKKQNETNVKHSPRQPQKPAKWVVEILARLKQAVTRVTERVTERKAETSELGEEYQRTQQNCIELDRLLKGGKWGPAIIQQQAFEADPALKAQHERQRAEQNKPKPSAPRLRM